MKRHALRITLCVLLGIVTTVGVALLAATTATGKHRLSRVSGTDRSILAQTFNESNSSLDWWTCINIGAATGEWRFFVPPHSGPVLLITKFGWPTRALWGEARAPYQSFSGGLSEGQMSWLIGELASNPRAQIASEAAFGIRNVPRPTPLRPILPGFIINTLFYAAIWFVLFFGFGFVKRAIRRKRGRCLRCGYDLRGQRSQVSDQSSEEHTGCPECGWKRAAAPP